MNSEPCGADPSPGPLDSHPLAAAHYADQAVQRAAEIIENVPLARDTYRVRFAAPELASHIVPGQFVMIRLDDRGDPLLARPFALYDRWCDDRGRPQGIDVVYLVVGKMTACLADCQPGARLTVWGPLGNGFSTAGVDHLLMIAGGIGQTPFLALGRQFNGQTQYGQPPQKVTAAAKTTLCYGARSADFLAGVADFEAAGIRTRVCTDDGSAGHHGLVTDLLVEELDQHEELDRHAASGSLRVACCGPEPMMEAVAEICGRRRVACEVSLETPMACGIGICFSCVAKVRQDDGEWDYKRTCVEGPVFDARAIAW